MMLGDLFLAVSGVVAALLFFVGALQAFRPLRSHRPRRRQEPDSLKLAELLEELAIAVRRLEDSNERFRDVIVRYQRSGIDPRTRRQVSPFRQPGESKSAEGLSAVPGHAFSDAPPVSGSPAETDSTGGMASTGALDAPAPESSELPGAGATFSARPVIAGATVLSVALMLGVFAFLSAGTLSVEPRSTLSVLGPAQQARMLVARGDYEGAWKYYYQALQAAPEDVRLWYAAGVVLSRLDKREATEQAFRYVVRQGKADSEEVRFARQWLVSAGVLAEPVEFSVGVPPLDVMGDRAVVKGKVTWGEPESDRVVKAQLILETLTGGARLATSVPLGDAYRFESLPAGSYRLIGGAAGHRLWNLTVTVEDGKEVVLDLGKDNSSNPLATIYL